MKVIMPYEETMETKIWTSRLSIQSTTVNIAVLQQRVFQLVPIQCSNQNLSCVKQRNQKWCTGKTLCLERTCGYWKYLNLETILDFPLENNYMFVLRLEQSDISVMSENWDFLTARHSHSRLYLYSQVQESLGVFK